MNAPSFVLIGNGFVRTQKKGGFTPRRAVKPPFYHAIFPKNLILHKLTDIIQLAMQGGAYGAEAKKRPMMNSGLLKGASQIRSFSASRTVLMRYCTASTGYLPWAVSPVSITAAAPSMQAL